MQLAELFVKVGADIGELQRKMTAAQRAVDSVGTAATRLGRNLTVAVTAPLTLLGGIAVRSAVQLDSLKRGLTSVAGSSEEAERQLARLAEVAKLPGLGFREAIQGSVRLQAAGFSAQLAEDALRGFGNALATVGAGKAELDQVSRALSQIASKGKISAEEINQIAEVVPQIRRVMQDAFGTSNSELLQKAGIDAQTFVRKVTDSLLELEQVTGGPANAFENLSDSLFRASATIGEKLLPAIIPLVEGLAGLLSEVRTLNPDTIRMGLAFAAVAAAAGPLAIAIGTMTTAAAALSTALGVGLLPLIGVGGAVVVGLGLLAGAFLNTKLEAIAARGEVEAFTNKLKALPLEAARMELGSVRARQAEIAEELLAPKFKTLAGQGSKAYRELKEEQEQVNEQVRVLARRISELSFAPIAEEGTEAFSDMAGAIDDVTAALEDAKKALDDSIGAMADRGMQPGGITGMGSLAMRSLGDAAMRRAQLLAIKRTSPNLGTVSAIGSAGLSTAAAGGGGLGAVFGALQTQVSGLVAAFGPLAITAAALKPVLDGFREAIGPSLEKLVEPLRSMGRALGEAVVPILEALAEPLRVLGKLVGALLQPLAASIQILVGRFKPALELLSGVLGLISKAMSYVNEAIGTFVKGLGIAIDALVPDWAPFIGDAGKGLKEFGQEMIDNAKAARKGTEVYGQLNKQVEKLSSSMTNVPVVFANALRRFQTTGGTVPTGGGPKYGPNNPPPGLPGGFGPKVQISGPVTVVANSPEEFARKMEDYGATVEWRGGYSRFSAPFG